MVQRNRLLLTVYWLRLRCFPLLLQAVCCSDHIHCCPAGTECDLLHSTCVFAHGETNMAVKIPAAVRGLVAAQIKGQRGLKQSSGNKHTSGGETFLIWDFELVLNRWCNVAQVLYTIWCFMGKFKAVCVVLRGSYTEIMTSEQWVVHDGYFLIQVLHFNDFVQRL